jgi:hypothetical protein
LALLHGEADRLEEARSEFEQLAVADFTDLPRDLVWLISIAILSEVCAYLRDDARLAMLYDLLLPYAGRTVVVGAPVIVCLATQEHQWWPAGYEMVWRQTKRALTTCLQSRNPPRGGPRLACVVTSDGGVERETGIEPATTCLEGRCSISW